MRKILLSLFLFSGMSQILRASGADEAASKLLRDQSKMNAVTAVLGIIFAGLAVWLFTLERRLRKMEKNQNQNSK